MGGLAMREVQGDGNCGPYAALASGPVDGIEHSERNGLRPTQRDYDAQQRLRDRAAAWWKRPGHTKAMVIEGTFSRRERQAIRTGVPDPLARDPRSDEVDWNAFAVATRGKTHAKDRPGAYIADAMWRAIAAAEGCTVVTLDSATLGDKVSLYPPGDVPPPGAKWMRLYKSWQQDIVPRLERQWEGRMRTDGSGTAESALRVIVWNGQEGRAGHFSATRPLTEDTWKPPPPRTGVARGVDVGKEE